MVSLLVLNNALVVLQDAEFTPEAFGVGVQVHDIVLPPIADVEVAEIEAGARTARDVCMSSASRRREIMLKKPMPRRKLFEARVNLPLTADLLAAIDALVEADETRVDLIRKAIKLELERRKAAGKTKAAAPPRIGKAGGVSDFGLCVREWFFPPKGGKEPTHTPTRWFA